MSDDPFKETLFKTEILQRHGLAYNRAKAILNEFDSLDELESASRSEVLEIHGVGEKTVENIGIWNDQGRPTEDIPRYPCLKCGDEYEAYVVPHGTKYDMENVLSEVSVPVEVCTVCRGDSSWLYFH